MAHILSIFAFIIQCIIGVDRGWAAAANTGHTTNNGGGLAELIVADLTANLAHFLAPCLTPANLCELEPRQITQIRSALVAYQDKVREISAHRLYTPDGAPLNRVQLLTLVLENLAGCESLLSGAPALIAERALRIIYHRNFSHSRSVTLVNPEKLILAESTLQTDLSQVLKNRLRVKGAMQIADIETALVNEAIDITGVVQLGPVERYRFQFRIIGPDRDLMVYP
jgi:hypothetical protein